MACLYIMITTCMATTQDNDSATAPVHGIPLSYGWSDQQQQMVEQQMNMGTNIRQSGEGAVHTPTHTPAPSSHPSHPVNPSAPSSSSTHPTPLFSLLFEEQIAGAQAVATLALRLAHTVTAYDSGTIAKPTPRPTQSHTLNLLISSHFELEGEGYIDYRVFPSYAYKRYLAFHVLPGPSFRPHGLSNYLSYLHRTQPKSPPSQPEHIPSYYGEPPPPTPPPPSNASLIGFSPNWYTVSGDQLPGCGRASQLITDAGIDSWILYTGESCTPLHWASIQERPVELHALQVRAWNDPATAGPPQARHIQLRANAQFTISAYEYGKTGYIGPVIVKEKVEEKKEEREKKTEENVHYAAIVNACIYQVKKYMMVAVAYEDGHVR